MHFSIPSLCLLLALLPSWALAQFGFFDQMFNPGHQQGRQQQQQQASGVTQYQARVDSGKFPNFVSFSQSYTINGFGL
jgi:hypothetical protein